jgi:hypothetical protein
MTLMAEDRSFIIRALALTGAGIVVALGALMLARSGRTPVVEVPLVSGDTPVVLVGGSLTFNAGDSTYPWAPVSGTTYQTTPKYPILKIVVKQDTGTDDSSAGSDKLRVDVSNATSWEVDEYISPAKAGDPDVQVTSITGVETNSGTASPIYLNLVKGYLCPGATKAITAITFGLMSGCTDPPNTIKFSKVSITINNQPQPTATLACYDSSDPQGQCRIVFRGH